MKLIKKIGVLLLIPIMVSIIAAILTSKIEKINIWAGLISFWNKIFKNLFFLLKFSIPIWEILIGIALLFIVFWLVRKRIKERNSLKPNMKWLRLLSNQDAQKCRFLLWYPLNGVHVAMLENMKPDIKIQVMSSPIIKKLIDHKIITLDIFELQMEIAEEVYDFHAQLLQTQCDKEDKEMIANLKSLKDAPFPNILAFYVLPAEINLE